MDSIDIKATNTTLSVIGSIKEGVLTVKGRSMPENAKDFYGMFKEWLQDFYKTEADKVHVTFEIEYYNTSSSNILMEIMKQLSDMSQSKSVSIVWIYEDDDIEMEEVGEDFKAVVGDILTLSPKKTFS